MDELNGKRKSWFKERKTSSVVGILFALGVIALVGLIACQQTTGVRSGTPSKAMGSVAAQPDAAKSEVPALLDSQCVFCHPQQPETIAKKGEKHRTEVGCQDCHAEHPPAGTEGIPACSMCHSGETHYELEQCDGCHVDTHAPLDLKLEGEITGPCLTCHQQQGDEVQKHPSAHTDLSCNECHADVHKAIPECTTCHEKHTEDMNFEACVSCHPVHMPTVVTYGNNTPSHYCGACHEEAIDLLAGNKTKHHDLSCVYCHAEKHKTVPPCAACHPNQHPDGILKKFPECGQCHGVAHDLKG